VFAERLRRRKPNQSKSVLGSAGADTVGEIFLGQACPLPKSLSQAWERDFEGSGSPPPILGGGAGGGGRAGQLEQAEVRAALLAAIDPNLDFGGLRSLKNLNQQIDQLQDKINAYNTALTAIDSLRSEIKEREKKLSDLSSLMLLGVAFQYGKDSQEYQMAGGVRSSDRSRRISAALIKSDSEPAAVEA
jgi:hypothetical protein